MSSSSIDSASDPLSQDLIRSTMLSGLCSIVPVPFLDDILLKRVRKGLLRRILQKHGSELDPDDIKAVYAGPPRGCFATVLGLVFSAIKKLIKKIVKTVFFFLAIRSAALDMVETYLLGRTVDRYLRRDFFRGQTHFDEQVRHFRRAFERALSGSDRRILMRAMKSGWRRVNGTRGIGRMMARRFGSAKTEQELQPEDLPAEDWKAVEKGSEEVSKQLESQEVRDFLAEFDAKFDQALEESVRPSDQA